MIIKQIVNTFYNLSEKHKLVRSFIYDRVSKKKGTGEQLYPMVMLEDPIYLNKSQPLQRQIPVQVNIDITMLPQAFNNFNVRQLTEVECQNLCHQIALSFVSKIRQDNKNIFDRQGLEIDNYSFITLRNWGDDNASGIRMTLNLLVDSDIQLCDIDEHFDPDKEFNLSDLLDDIDTDDATGCVQFDYKLPKINI